MPAKLLNVAIETNPLKELRNHRAQAFGRRFVSDGIPKNIARFLFHTLPMELCATPQSLFNCLFDIPQAANWADLR